MISILQKIRIHPLFWVVIATGIVTGYFYEILMLFFIVFVHELGHAFMAHKYKWRIKKIELLPFGGVAEINEYGNRPLKEEIAVTIAGPIQHVLLAGLSFIMLLTPYWNAADHQTFLFHNGVIFFFNLLPVWPLDGGKLLFFASTAFMPYRKAQKYFLVLSFSILVFLTIGTILSFPYHLQSWVILLFLYISHYLERKQQPYGFFRFLLERNRMFVKGVLPSRTEKVSQHTRLIDAAKMIRKNAHTIFLIEENGEKVSEEELLYGITRENVGMKSFSTFLTSDKR
ncbi:M50 family metallopeptidase [Thalassorhabdus alkalitolerans]|uniref:M50 family metallopeptidase n=1 Tax=Thalassorhabdus alkalitolerans TaxID=2282697 RepID=A0ABW0YLM7_9BACI